MAAPNLVTLAPPHLMHESELPLEWERAFAKEDVAMPHIAKLRIILPRDFSPGSSIKFPVPCVCGHHSSRFTKTLPGRTVIVKWDLNICRLIDNSDTNLVTAVRLGDKPRVEALLASGQAVDQATNNGFTPLIFACHFGYTQIASALIVAGAAVDRRTNTGVTPLYAACKQGRACIAKLLLDHKPTRPSAVAVDQPTNSGSTPLLIACERGHADVVSALLAGGANVNQVRSNGATPLLVACVSGHAEVAAVLLSAGATVNRARDGLTPLLVACCWGHLRCVQVASSYGAARAITWNGLRGDAEGMARNQNHMEVVAWLSLSSRWTTPLHHLAIIGAERARAELRAGADVLAAARVPSPARLTVRKLREALGERSLPTDGLKPVLVARLAAAIAADPPPPTPLSIAREMRAADPPAADGSPAHLVLRAAEPWSPHNHELFPEACRKRAVQLLLLGELLAREPLFDDRRGSAVSLKDCWMDFVMPQAVRRFCHQPGILRRGV